MDGQFIHESNFNFNNINLKNKWTKTSSRRQNDSKSSCCKFKIYNPN